MKIILTKHQHNNLLSEGMGDSNVIKFDRNSINAFQKVVKKMKIRESEETEFIEKYEKNSKLAKKYESLIINLLKKTFGDDLYNISTNHTNRAYGSIWINDPKTNTKEMFSGPKIIFTLEFINKNKLEQQQIRETTYNTLESFTPFNMKEYGCPIDVRFINYEKKEF